MGLASILWICLGGFFGGQLARRCRLPALVGMIVAGILLGPQVSHQLGQEEIAAAGGFRSIAVMVILLKAGLGLDREKLYQQSSVALRLGLLPGACEAMVVAIAATILLQFDWTTGLLLGCILGAESPAVIVPAMLQLKQQGWGVRKGIPDAILTGSALSDVLLLLVFSLLMNLSLMSGSQAIALPWGLSLGLSLNPWLLLPIQLLTQVLLGLGLGWVAAKLLVRLLRRSSPTTQAAKPQSSWSQNGVQDTLIVAGVALALILTAEQWPWFSGYLAAMALGFFLVSFDAPLARQLRQGFASLWEVAQIFLFVLLGANLPLMVLNQTLGVGLSILLLGTLMGRSLGWWLSTLGSNWNRRERGFLLPGNSAKATVQAAIGAIPLSQGIEGGDTILAIAVLSILVTAPLGAWAIPKFAPQLLEKGPVDPTKVWIQSHNLLLVAVDANPQARWNLQQAAARARQVNGEVLVLHVCSPGDTAPSTAAIADLQLQVQSLLADLRHRLMVVPGEDIAQTLCQVAQTQGASEILLGANPWEGGDRLPLVFAQANIPITLIPSPSPLAPDTSPQPKQPDLNR